MHFIYPANDDEANLLLSLISQKNITPGYSDHTIGSLALKSAYIVQKF